MCGIRIVTRLSLCSALLLAFTATHAQSAIDRLALDRALAFGGGEGAKLVSTEGAPSFSYLDKFNGNTLVSCQLTPFDGLYCIDFKAVRHWADPLKDGQSTLVVDCEESVLGLDGRKDNTCTSVAIDADGVIWLGGKDKGKANTLFKFVASNGICVPLTSNPGLCPVEVASGRPLLMDLVAVDGLGILALEGGKSLVAFRDDGTTDEIAGGKADLQLIGPEQLASLSFFAFGDRNFALLATTAGRILAWDLAGSGPASVALESVTWGGQTTGCNGVPGFAVRASAGSGIIYMSNGASCEVAVLERTSDDTAPLALGLVSGPVSTGLATTTGLTVGPANVVNLANCGDMTCSLVEEGRAELTYVKLASDASGLTYFEVKGVPDCRWQEAALNKYVEGSEDHARVSAIFANCPAAPAHPERERLDITPFLPELIHEMFKDPGLPPLLIPRYVRGQYENDFLINGLFGVTEKGVLFRDTFELYYKWERKDADGNPLPPYQPYFECTDENLLHWDVAGTISEHFTAADNTHLMFVTNTDCGGTRTVDPRFSFKPSNLQPTQCTFNPDDVPGADVIWRSDGVCSGLPEDADDAVYAKMLLIMADDFAKTVTERACKNADEDPAGPAALDTAGCQMIESRVDNMIDKLHKCWYAAQMPKQSSGDQNCSAFDSQLANLENELEYEAPLAQGARDPANRHGELKARAKVMRYVFEKRFMESLLRLRANDEHFVEPQPSP